MNIRDFKQSLDYLFKAGLTPFVWGHAGIGKTESIKQYAKEKNFKFFAFHLGTQSDNGDILGLQEFVKNDEGRTIGVEHAMPMWVRNLIDYCEANPDSGAVLFLDEFNRAHRDLYSGMFSLVLDKRFHTIQLPSNCYIVAAGNPPTDEYVTTDVDEHALMSRFAHVKLEPTKDEWFDYARKVGIKDSILQFFRQQSELFDTKTSIFELPVKFDRRAIFRWNNLEATGAPPHLLEQLVPGIIGLERMVAYQQFLREQDVPLTGAEVLAGAKAELLTKWCDPLNTMGSLIHISCENLVAAVKAYDSTDSKLSDSEKKHLFEFFVKIPKDKSYPFIQTLVDTESKAFKEFYLMPEYEDGLCELIKSAKGIQDGKEAAVSKPE